MSDTDQIRNTTLKNLIWRFTERCGAQGIAFVVSIIVARIVSPEQYGTVALITVFINILQVFVDSGLGSALIQKKNADQVDFSTVFYFNIIMCLFLYLVLYIAAPYISLFYDDPQLTSVTRTIGLTLIVSGVRNIQQAYVTKHMMFKRFFYSTLFGTLISAVIGIVMAYNDFGVWAIVAQNLTNVTVSTIVLFITVKWRPTAQFAFNRFKELFSYGWKLLVSALLDTGYNELRQLLIGKLYTSGDLAYYNQGNKFPHFIVNNINSSIDSVLLPAMSQKQDDVVRVKAMTRRAIRTSTYIMAPLMIGLAICSENIVYLLLKEKWLGCVPYLRIFCITYLFYPIHTANLNAIKAMGRSDLFLKLELIKKGIGILVLIFSIRYGVLVMACSLLVTTLVSTIINAYPNKKLLDYNWFEQMRDILPNILLALIMAIPVYGVSVLGLPAILVLCVQVILGAIIYIGLSRIMRLEIYYYIEDMINSTVLKKKKV